MTYHNIVEGIFLSRPNRFIAHCLVDGKEEICHVKNTGRCKELLIPGVKVHLQHLPSPTRKTQFDLIGVDKQGVLFNIDSQAPNRAVAEWLPVYLGKNAFIQPEYSFGESRLDFYAKVEDRMILMEVKGVTLERDGVALFPDAPTLRGAKHLRELASAARDGYECYVLFVIQADGITSFAPNAATDPDFAHYLRQAEAAGVQILAYDCHVTPNSMTIRSPIPVTL